MMTSIFEISFLLFVLAYPCHAQNDYIKCQTSSECQPNHCCTLGISFCRKNKFILYKKLTIYFFKINNFYNLFI